MSQLVPSPGDMNTLVEAFKETVRGTYDGNRGLLHSLCAGIGEVRLRGVCRRLSTPERAEMIDLLLPDIEATSGKSQGLVQRLMDTAPNLSTLHNTFDTIGFEKLMKDRLIHGLGRGLPWQRPLCTRPLMGRTQLG